jgi:outer membrane protein OmpA-like peptidoglycan-associated protein
MEKFPLFLACRKCNSTQLDAHRICKACGPVNGLYLYQHVFDDKSVELVCENCHLAIELSISLRVPHSCFDCGSADLDWRELNTLRWLQNSPEVDANNSDIWISGQFDGNYSGSLIQDSGGALDQSRQFSIVINDGILYNPRRVRGPPIKKDSGEVKPLHQQEIKSVHICEGEPDSHALETIYIGQLDDFTLHDWSNLSKEVNGAKNDSLLGRVFGTAYAILKPPNNTKKVSLDSHHDSSSARSASNQRVESSAIGNVWNKLNELTRSSSQTKAAGQQQNIGQPSQDPLSYPQLSPVEVCKKCHWLLTCLVFGMVWITCSLMHAAIAIAPLIAICYLARVLTEGLAPSLRWNDRVSSWIGCLLIITALLILGFFAIPTVSHYECSTAFPWWLWVVALILIFASILPQCWPWFLMVIIWVFAILINYSGPCFSSMTTGSIFEKTPVAQVEKKDAADTDKTQKVKEKLSEHVSKKQEAEPSKTQKILGDIQRIAERVVGNIDDNIKNLISSDEDGNLVADSSKTKRADLDMAANNPNKYFTCPNSSRKVDIYDIYIGGAALFPFNDAQLSPDAKIYLNKLKKLMALRPEVKIILTGNSDIAGSEDVKFQKSLDRARTLANWLVENDVTTMEKIQVKGASDFNLYIQDPRPEMQALNRRVDLRIDCPAMQ